jgi:superfamily I DNA/RNA helicase
VISTAHKAKGREWAKVRLMDDFLRSQPGQRQPQDARTKDAHDPAEVRLFYVALTRAKEAIDVPPTVLSLIG